MQRSQRVLTQQTLLMPHKENGDFDWTTLGNILIAQITGEVLCASYLDVKHRAEHPNFLVDTDWKYSYEEKDVVVLNKQCRDSPFHCWMGRTVINLPLMEVAAFIANPDSAVIFDKYIVESKVVEKLSHSDSRTDLIAYYKSEAKHCLLKTTRDFLFYVCYAHIDGRYVQTAISVDHPQCPIRQHIPRAQIQPGSGWHLEPYRGDSQRTLVSYVAQVDLIGLPPVIANRVLRRQPMNILHVKKHLMKKGQSASDSNHSQVNEMPTDSCQKTLHHSLPAYDLYAVKQ